MKLRVTFEEKYVVSLERNHFEISSTWIKIFHLQSEDVPFETNWVLLETISFHAEQLGAHNIARDVPNETYCNFASQFHFVRTQRNGSARFAGNKWPEVQRQYRWVIVSLSTRFAAEPPLRSAATAEKAERVGRTFIKNCRVAPPPRSAKFFNKNCRQMAVIKANASPFLFARYFEKRRPLRRGRASVADAKRRTTFPRDKSAFLLSLSLSFALLTARRYCYSVISRAGEGRR